MRTLFFFAARNVFLLSGLLFVTATATAAEPTVLPIGVARMDVTPAEPIRLTGYGSRRTNSIGVEQKLWAKALALGADADGPALLLTLDNCGIAEPTYLELVRRLYKSAGLKQHQLAIAYSHTHSGPCTTDWAPNIFSQDIAPDQQAAIDRYTRGLLDKLEQVALAALKDRRPGTLAWSQGNVSFARNRRVVQAGGARFGENAAGPVDHALPVLRATDVDGKLRAVVANYACHCTTMGGEFNHLHGDWAGCAQEFIERDHPGAVALITIGCGADANPSPRGSLVNVRQHGEDLAAEVKRLLPQAFVPLRGKLSTRLKRIELPFDTPFTRAQWEERAAKSGIVGYHAKKYLARLDRGEKLPTTLPYYVQTWTFGDELALVFLPGEVVVDYALRLKREFDPARLWVSSYANYVPCYIPSRRILHEGGYEAEDSLWYYDRPGRLAPATEDLIVNTVHELLPKEFLFDEKKAEFPPPKTPDEALAAFRVSGDFAVELAAAEPLVQSPVAIDWGADAKLWVCEMFDYPTGLDGQGRPGGRVKFLEDTNGDGRFDKATLFLDHLPFPTGVMAWRKGALICAAPDILYAEDTNGDGKADVVRTNFSGFATHNFQARVNGLTWGLDGWVYGAAGLFGGKIKSVLTGTDVELSGRDFRIHPDTGEFEPVSGLSQQGRVRDDWGNWFGNDNGTLLWHFPLPDHYARRNPNVPAPDPRVYPVKDANPNRLFPVSRTLERFNDPHAANRTTSACGPEIYRDDLLGTNHAGNAFICEPVHNLVHRLALAEQGATFTARRAAEEQRSEFLASTDNWFRPVQARTGPDGALWIVDMYRFVVEHPRWIPAERLAKLDVRAGADQGRIYRVTARGKPLHPVRDLTKLPPAELTAALDTPNGPTRDLVHRELLQRADATAVARLAEIAGQSRFPAARAQALCVLDGLSVITRPQVRQALADPHPGVRRTAARLSEPFLANPERVRIPANPALTGVAAAQNVSRLDELSFTQLTEALRRLTNDPNASVRFQLALSLGEWNDPRAGTALGNLALAGDTWTRAAVFSSAARQPGEILKVILAAPLTNGEPGRLIGPLIATAAAGTTDAFEKVLIAVANLMIQRTESWKWPVLVSLIEAMERRQIDLNGLIASSVAEVRQSASAIAHALMNARMIAVNQLADEDARVAALQLVGRGIGGDPEVELLFLGAFIKPEVNDRLQKAALDRLARSVSATVPTIVLANWSRQLPAMRAAILATLVSREEWTKILLDTVAKGRIAPGEIPAASRQRLLKHKRDDIRQHATGLFAANGSADRAQVLAQYQTVAALTGDAANGGAVFAKNCASCHAFGGQGQALGPDLAAFRDKSVTDFLAAIFDPNAAIEPRFLGYEVTTRDGRSLSGVIRAETATGLTLVQAGGVEEKVLRGDIKEIKAAALSLMPEGLEQAMNPQDVADLLAHLRQAGPAPFGGASAEQAAKARTDFLKGGVNGLGKLVSASEQLNYPSWLGSLPLAHCRQTDGQSKMVWQTAVVPSGLAAGAVEKFRLPAALGFASQPAGKFHLRLNGKPALDFDVTLTDQTWSSADGQVRLSYAVRESNSEDSNGILTIEVAASRLESGKPATFEVTGSAARSQRWFGIYLVEGKQP